MESDRLLMMEKKNNCWLLFGNDSVLIHEKRQRFIEKYFGALCPDPVVFDGTGTYADWMEQIRGQSLFSEASAVFLNNPSFFMHGVQDEEGFADFIKTLQEAPSSVAIVISYEGIPDRRMKAAKTLFQICSSMECSFLKLGSAESYLTECFHRRRVLVTEEARLYLSDVITGWAHISIPFLETECDKIALMARGGIVSKEIMENALPSYMDKGVFRFFDHLLERNLSAVKMDIPGIFTDESASLMTLGFLSSRLRRIKIFHEMKRSGSSDAHIQKILGIRTRWSWNELLKQTKCISEEEAEFLLMALFQYQYAARLEGADSHMLTDILFRFCRRGGIS
jgi:DNA polymerase III delta subunit